MPKKFGKTSVRLHESGSIQPRHAREEDVVLRLESVFGFGRVAGPEVEVTFTALGADLAYRKGGELSVG